MDDQQATHSSDEIETPAPPTDDGTAAMVMNIEGTIKTHMLQIDQLTEELKKQQDMLNDVFVNDAGFQEQSEKVKEANKVKMAVKGQILNRPEVANLSGKVKTMRSQIKDLKEALSDYLSEYQRLSGLNQIEGYDGQMREIVYVAKLVRPDGR